MTKTELNKEAETRMKSFNEELLPLLKKYKVGLTCIPSITREFRVVSELTVVDVEEKEPNKLNQA